jgi:endogenous inhibitor of DNA gyrase (YacG/DUF329 family)
MAWQAVEAEIAREMREYSNTENLEELLYQAWLYSMSLQREKHRNLYGTWRLSPDWKEKKRAHDAKCKAKRAAEREAVRLSDVRTCAECGAAFTRGKLSPGQKYCGPACAQRVYNREYRAKVAKPEPKPAGPSLVCARCEKSFQRSKFAPTQRFCSRTCKRQADHEERNRQRAPAG